MVFNADVMLSTASYTYHKFLFFCYITNWLLVRGFSVHLIQTFTSDSSWYLI